MTHQNVCAILFLNQKPHAEEKTRAQNSVLMYFFFAYVNAAIAVARARLSGRRLNAPKSNHAKTSTMRPAVAAAAAAAAAIFRNCGTLALLPHFVCSPPAFGSNARAFCLYTRKRTFVSTPLTHTVSARAPPPIGALA